MSTLRELPPSGHGRARGLVSSRVSGARVEARSYAPSPALADVIERLWMGRWDLVGQAPHVTELLGDPCVHLVLERGCSRVVGVWTRRWIRRLEGRGLVRAAKLRPGAARAFVTVPARELSDRLTPIGELLAVDAERLEAAVLDPEDDTLAFAAFEARLTELRRCWPSESAARPNAGSPGPGAAEVQRAIDACAQLSDPTLRTVEALAERCQMSVRSLQRLFAEHVGAGPKRLLRRLRLQEAALRIEQGKAPNLAALAAELGYSDQAHFNREFRSVVGKTPRELGDSLWR